MSTKSALSVVALVCALGFWGCTGGTLPTAPSELSTASAPASTGARLHTSDDPPPPAIDPTPPAADPAPPTPLQVIVKIVGSFGSNAFMPNPSTANMGDQLVFANGDTVLHHIVLDDGTDLGDVPPGQSSAPVALKTPTASYHCTIHPTMVGSINGDLPLPTTPPPYSPPPADDYYGYYSFR